MQFASWQHVKRQASDARDSGDAIEPLPSSGVWRERMNASIQGAEQLEGIVIDLVRAELRGKETSELSDRLYDTVRQIWPWDYGTTDPG
jgi:hypothetical protein